MIKKAIKTFAAAGAIWGALTGAPASAQVTYTLAGFSDVVSVAQSFSFTVDDFLTADQTIPISDFTACEGGSGDCVDAKFYENDPYNNFTTYSLLAFDVTGSSVNRHATLTPFGADGRTTLTP